MVETNKSKNSTPITFDWTDISYPKQWEVRYIELRDFETTKNQQLSIPKPLIRGNLGSKMGLIRKRANNKFCELEFKN